MTEQSNSPEVISFEITEEDHLEFQEYLKNKKALKNPTLRTSQPMGCPIEGSTSLPLVSPIESPIEGSTSLPLVSPIEWSTSLPVQTKRKTRARKPQLPKTPPATIEDKANLINEIIQESDAPLTVEGIYRKIKADTKMTRTGVSKKFITDFVNQYKKKNIKRPVAPSKLTSHIKTTIKEDFDIFKRELLAELNVKGANKPHSVLPKDTIEPKQTPKKVKVEVKQSQKVNTKSPLIIPQPQVSHRSSGLRNSLFGNVVPRGQLRRSGFL